MTRFSLYQAPLLRNPGSAPSKTYVFSQYPHHDDATKQNVVRSPMLPTNNADLALGLDLDF